MENTSRLTPDLYKKIVENASLSIVIIQNFKICYCNQITLDNFGFSEEELLSGDFTDFIHPDDRQMVGENFKKRMMGEPIDDSYRFRLLNKAGETRWVRAKADRILYNNGHATLAFFTDITREVEQEYEILRHTRFMERLIEQSPLPTFVTDKKGVVVMVNRAFLDTYGVKDASAYRDFAILEDPLNISLGIDKYFMEALSGRVVNTPEISLTSPASGRQIVTRGKVFPLVDENNEVSNIVVVQEDITDIIQSEKTRKEYLKNMEILSASAMELINFQSKNDIYKYVVSVIQSLTNAMLVVIAEITPDGNTYIPRNIKGNDKLLQQLYAGLNGSVIDKELPFGEPAVSEMRKGELIDVPGGLYGFTFEMASPEICRNIEALYNIGRIRSMGIIRKGKLFGNIAFVQETGADSGNSVFIETFIKQVSITLYHLNVEEELIISKEKAEASDRLKSAFLANMSHEIRTPLNAIAGFSQVLNRKYIDEFKRGEYLSYIQKNCETLQVLINDILSISQIESEKLKLDTKECNLNRFLHELHTTFSEEIRKDHSKTIRLILSPMSRNADFVIMTDPNRLRQILMNLLSNAIKFTSTGSVEFGYEVISEYTLLFFVKDTGIGIPKDKHDVIFERFHRLESGSSGKFSGTGLGLSISKSLVGLLGGELWLDSEPDNGSRFYFTINYRQAEYSGPMVEEADQDPEFFRWAGKTILIAEDEDFNYLVLEEILGETGATIIRARNGKEAIDIFESGRHIDITLMDLQMPMLDGYQASRIILEKFPGIPIIAQTAYAMDSEKDKCMEAGISDYITKPIDMGLLMKKINFFIME